MPESQSSGMRARQSIRRLRQGVVPQSAIKSVLVGYEGVGDSFLQHIGSESSKRGKKPIFVRGEFGTGKSNYISYIRHLCEERKIATSTVQLNANNRPLSQFQYLYPELVMNLQRVTIGKQMVNGIQDVIRAALNEESLRKRLLSFASSPSCGELRVPILNLAVWAESQLAPISSQHPSWKKITGADITFNTALYLREKGLSRIKIIAQLLRELGSERLVLFFDEAETIDQLFNICSRCNAYAALERLSRLDGVVCYFAITRRFENIIQRDLDRGILSRRSLSMEGQAFLKRWIDGQFKIVEPPEIDLVRAVELSRKVRTLYEMGYGISTLPQVDLTSLAREWSGGAARNPRVLIRQLVDQLDSARPLVLQEAEMAFAV